MSRVHVMGWMALSRLRPPGSPMQIVCMCFSRKLIQNSHQKLKGTYDPKKVKNSYFRFPNTDGWFMLRGLDLTLPKKPLKRKSKAGFVPPSIFLVEMGGGGAGVALETGNQLGGHHSSAKNSPQTWHCSMQVTLLVPRAQKTPSLPSSHHYCLYPQACYRMG